MVVIGDVARVGNNNGDNHRSGNESHLSEDVCEQVVIHISDVS